MQCKKKEKPGTRRRSLFDNVEGGDSQDEMPFWSEAAFGFCRCLPKDYAEKMAQMDGLVTYEDTSAFEKTVSKYKSDLRKFFKEQGLVE